MALLLFFANFANLQFTILINQYIYNITTRRLSNDDESASKTKQSPTNLTKTDPVVGIFSAMGAIGADDKEVENKALDNATKYGIGGNKRKSNNNIVTGIPLFGMFANDGDAEGNKKAPQQGEEQVFTEDKVDEYLEDSLQGVEADSDKEPDDKASDNYDVESEDKERFVAEEASKKEPDQTDAIDANDEAEVGDATNTDISNDSKAKEDFEAEIGQLIEDNQEQLMTVGVMVKAFKPVLERIENSSDPDLASHANEEKIVSQLESVKKVARNKAMEYLPVALEASGKSLPKTKSLEDFVLAWENRMLGIDRLIRKHQKLASDAQREEEQATQDLIARFAKMQNGSDEEMSK